MGKDDAEYMAKFFYINIQYFLNVKTANKDGLCTSAERNKLYTYFILP